MGGGGSPLTPNVWSFREIDWGGGYNAYIHVQMYMQHLYYMYMYI